MQGSNWEQWVMKCHVFCHWLRNLVRTMELHEMPIIATENNGYDVPCFQALLTWILTKNWRHDQNNAVSHEATLFSAHRCRVATENNGLWSSMFSTIDQQPGENNGFECHTHHGNWEQWVMKCHVFNHWSTNMVRTMELHVGNWEQWCMKCHVFNHWLTNMARTMEYEVPCLQLLINKDGNNNGVA
jgi:hypothetical protein